MLKLQNMDRSCINIQSQTVVKISALENEDELCNLLDCSAETEIRLCGVVEINGYKYRANIMVMTEWNGELPKFARVEHIIQRGSTLVLIVKPWKTHFLHGHFQAFAASEDLSKPFKLIEPDELQDHKPLHAVKSYKCSDNTWYIPTRYLVA